MTSEALTGDDVFAQILLLMAVPSPRAILLVEGPSDCSCLAAHILTETAQLLPCHGSQNLDRAIELVDQEGVLGVLALRDSDWIGLLYAARTSRNIVYTDLYDLDSSLFLCTEVGHRLPMAFGRPANIERHVRSTGVGSGIELAARIASELGRMRLVSARYSLGLRLDDFPIHEVCDPRLGTVARDALIRLVLQRSESPSCTAEELAEYLDQELSVDAYRVCSGHDVVSVLAFLIRAAWGGRPHAGKAVILDAAHAALSCGELMRLKLYDGVCEWEDRTGRRVWACRPTGPEVATPVPLGR